MNTAAKNVNAAHKTRSHRVMRHAMDVMLVSLSTMVMVAGYFSPEISFYMAGA